MRLHGVALRTRIPRAHVRSTGKKRSVYRAAVPADGTPLPITRGDLGTSRLKGRSGERYTSCSQCERRRRLTGGTGNEGPATFNPRGVGRSQKSRAQRN